MKPNKLKTVTKCPCCGNTSFNYNPVLWSDLIKQWELSNEEIEYINYQQGLACNRCSNNLRSMALAAGIMHYYNFNGILESFCLNNKYRNINILELNEAGNLSLILSQLKNYQLKCYPEIDIQNMEFEDNTFDLIIHSDTLEHIPNTNESLSESIRILNNNGVMIFTVPIIYNRMNRSRVNMQESYHGSIDEKKEDYKVYTEYGADVWVDIIRAGYRSCEIFSFHFPSGIVIIARK